MKGKAVTVINEMVLTKSDCGVANLLAAIWGTDKIQLKIRLGIPVRRCLNCDELIEHLPTPCVYCSHECRKAHKQIKLECPECGKIFERYQPAIICHTNRPRKTGKTQQYFFCSKHCQGKWVGRNHGFGVHGKRYLGGGTRKYNYPQIMELVAIGCKVEEIAKILNMNTKAIQQIKWKVENGITCVIQASQLKRNKYEKAMVQD